MNGIHTSNKRQKLSEWIKTKQNRAEEGPSRYYLQETHFKYKAQIDKSEEKFIEFLHKYKEIGLSCIHLRRSRLQNEEGYQG